MSIIDNTLAAQVPTFDPATPLAQAAKLQAADQEMRANQFKQAQLEIGSEARGLAAVQNSPEFPARWAEAADRMLQKGLLTPQAHQQWRNTPSPLLLKQMIAQTEDPTLSFRKEEAGRDQKNINFNQKLALRKQDELEDPTPDGFEADPNNPGSYRPLPGGPKDPNYLAKVNQIEGRKNLPSGFEPDPVKGGLRPIAGGPADPEYLRGKPDKQNAPSGYMWNDPSDPSKGMTAIPGGPGEKTDAEVAGRLGLAKSFLGELPDIKKRVEAGELTGIVDASKAYMGVGGPGEIRRKIDSGAEALLRMLTGAGMNKDEAKEYTRRYKFSPSDTASTVISKLNQLERELNSVGETVGKGRGGWVPPGKETSKPSGLGKDADMMLGQARDAIAQGAPRDAVIKRLKDAGITSDYL